MWLPGSILPNGLVLRSRNITKCALWWEKRVSRCASGVHQRSSRCWEESWMHCACAVFPPVVWCAAWPPPSKLVSFFPSAFLSSALLSILSFPFYYSRLHRLSDHGPGSSLRFDALMSFFKGLQIWIMHLIVHPSLLVSVLIALLPSFSSASVGTYCLPASNMTIYYYSYCHKAYN